LNFINISVMKNTLLFLSLITSVFGQAQYYYKDIIGTTETNNLLKLFTSYNIQSVSLKSYEADGSISDNFQVEQVLDKSNKTLKTISHSGVTDESVLNSWFDDHVRVIKTTDTSGTSLNTAVYTYNSTGKLVSIKSFSGDTLKTGTAAEDHQWYYNEKGQPVQMLRIINAIDTTLIKILADENGNITQETPYKKGKAGDPVYYYYNEKNQITDIVRYNYKLKKLLPDYMFEYSDAGQVIQKITVPSNKAAAYLIWRYQYDSRGLKVREACFNKDKVLTGKIEYNYRFSQ
jgi:antitoxin component YwqK of YwqJK toxin-antitoxin module